MGVVASFPKIPLPLFIYNSLQCIHKFIVKRKNTKYATGKHIRNLGSLIKKSNKEDSLYINTSCLNTKYTILISKCNRQ